MEPYQRGALTAALLGAGLTAVTVLDMSPWIKIVVGGFGIAMIVLAIGILAYPAVRERLGTERLAAELRGMRQVGVGFLIGTLLVLVVVFLDPAMRCWWVGEGCFAGHAMRTLRFVEGVSNASRFAKDHIPPLIKIVSSSEDRKLADMILKALQMNGFKIMINEQEGSYIFPARTRSGGIVLRTRPSDIPGAAYLSSALGALTQSGLGVENEKFPDDEKFNYIQIEIGGGM